MTSAANGQPIPAAAARPRYSRTVLGAMPSSRPIVRVLALVPETHHQQLLDPPHGQPLCRHPTPPSIAMAALDAERHR